MKQTSKELKRLARETLIGHYGVTMAAFTVTELILLFANLPFNLFLESNPTGTQRILSFLASMIISLLSTVLNGGMLYIHLNLARGKETKLSDLFFFVQNRPDRFILADLLLMLILFSAALPAVIGIGIASVYPTAASYALMAVLLLVSLLPVCILSLTYDLIYLLLIEQPQSGIRSVFEESRRLMAGNKGRKLYLSLSFIGMTSLSVLSFGIGLLWVIPYRNQTIINFYRNVTGEI